MAEPAARSSLLIDNERVRVTEWRLAPGTATGHHRHALDYVIVPITGGTLTIRDATGEHEAPLARGEPYFRDEGVEHDVLNLGGEEIVFVEIEIK